MNRQRRAYFQKQLSSWQEEIQRSLRTAAHERSDDEGAEADITDRGSRSYEKELSLLTAAQHQESLQKVQRAEYGQCLTCGAEINSKRLEAVPWTQYCIQCQQNLEQGRGQTNPK
jgi:DnaK suppressor protein